MVYVVGEPAGEREREREEIGSQTLCHVIVAFRLGDSDFPRHSTNMSTELLYRWIGNLYSLLPCSKVFEFFGEHDWMV